MPRAQTSDGPGPQKARENWQRARGALCSFAIAVLAVAFAGCGLGAMQAEEEASSEVRVAAAPHPEPLPPERQVEAIVDPSGSVPRRYLRATLGALASAIRAIPRPLQLTGSSPPQPAVRVRVRAVAGNSYSPAAQLAAGTVRAIPGIAPLPADDNADLTAAAAAIDQQRTAARKALAGARADATALAEQVSSLDPPVAGCSDVYGAISAASESFTSPTRRLFLATDLDQHCAANASGSLQGVEVLISHICENAAVCQAQRATWQQRLSARGAASVRFVRIENMYMSLRAFVTGR